MAFSRDRDELAAQAEALRLLSLLFDAPDPSLLPAIEGLRGLDGTAVGAVESP